MQAYKAGITKRQFVAEMKKHQKADAFLKGTYQQGNGKSFRGCAVGCGINSINRLKRKKLSHNSHEELSKHLGIPYWLARVEDTLFEGVSVERSKTWPVEFAEALQTGKNYDGILKPFLAVIIKSTFQDYDPVKYPDVFKAST